MNRTCFCGSKVPLGRKKYCSDECRRQGNRLRTRAKRAGVHVHSFRCTGCGAGLNTGRPRKDRTLARNAPQSRNKPLCGGSLAKGVPQSLKLRKSGGITLTICRQKAWFGRTFTNVPIETIFSFLSLTLIWLGQMATWYISYGSCPSRWN